MSVNATQIAMDTLRQKYIVVIAIIIAASLLLTGCAMKPGVSDKVSRELAHIEIERVGSSAANITHAYLSYEDGMVLLRGELKKRIIQRGIIPGRLQIEVIDAEKKTVFDRVVRYSIVCRSTSRSKFVYRIPEEQGNISMIRISHHNDN